MTNLRFAVLVAIAVASLQLGSFGFLPTPTASALTNCTVNDLTIDAEEARVLTLINNYRPAGAPDLVMSVELNRAATWMAVDLTHSAFSHTDSLGRDPWTRMAQCDVPAGSQAENLAAWYVTADDVFAGWRGSPPHDRNMLDPSYNYIGIARVCCGPEGQWYWATDFNSVGTPMAAGLGAPSNVSVAQPTSNSLNVWFNDNATTEYAIDIERGSSTSGPWTVIKSTGQLPGAQAGWYWPDSGLNSETQYCYRLRARDVTTYSGYSNVACGTTSGNALGAPSNVSVAQPTSNSLNVWFNDNATAEYAIDIERGTSSSGPWTVIKSTGQLPGAQAGWYWPDSGLNGATQYCYRLRARDATTFSAYSNVACGTTTGNALGAPSNVSVAQPTSSGLNVWFNDNATTEYAIDIERSTGASGPWAVIKSTGQLQGAQAGWYWPDSGLNPATQYCYRLRARDATTFSAYSNVACGTTTGNALGAPSNVSVAQPTSSGLNVWFTDNATTETGIDIERRVGQTGSWSVVKTTTVLQGAQAGWYWPDTGRNANTEYCYRLRAKNNANFSAYSNVACGRTTP